MEEKSQMRGVVSKSTTSEIFYVRVLIFVSLFYEYGIIYPPSILFYACLTRKPTLPIVKLLIKLRTYITYQNYDDWPIQGMIVYSTYLVYIVNF